MSAILWVVWLVAIVVLTAGQAKWEFDYFAHPGPAFQRALAIAIPAGLAISALYVRWRRRGLWRFELRILAAIAVAAMLFYEPRAFFVCAGIFTACYTFGHFVKVRLGLDGGGALEDTVLSAGLGFAALIPALFVLGLFHGYYAWTLAALLLLPAALLWRHIPPLWRSMCALDRCWQQAEELRSPLAGIAVVFAGVSLVCACMVVLAPSLAFDVLYMHLPLAQFYQAHHALAAMPGNDYSWYPQGVEVLMTVGLILGGQPCAQLLPPVFFLLTVLLLFRIVRACGGSTTGALCGTVFAAALPFVHWTGSVAKNDLALSFFELAALYCYVRWREDNRFRWIQLGVIFAAAAFGVKDVVAFATIPLAFLFIHAAWRQPVRWRALTSLALLFLTFGVCWQMRTLLVTRRQIAPGAASVYVRNATSAGAHPLSKVLRYVTVPWTVHFNGPRAFESPLIDPMGTFLIAFVPVWFMKGKRKAPIERVCLIFIGLFLPTWALFWAKLRYAIAPLALLSALTGNRVAGFYERSSPRVRPLVLAACAYSAVFALMGSAIIELNGPQLSYFARRIDKAGYLRQALLTYSSLEFLGKVTVPGDTAAGVGNCSNAYAPRGVVFESRCTWSEVAGFLPARIQCGGVGYLIVADDENKETVESQTRQRRSITRLYDDGRFSVFRLEPCGVSR